MVIASKVLSVFNSLVIALELYYLIAFLGNTSTVTNGWGDIILGLFGLMFIMASLILTIPLVIFKVKLKKDLIKYYFYSHIVMFVLALVMFGSSIIINRL